MGYKQDDITAMIFSTGKEEPMSDIKKVWKIENGTGHWMLYLYGQFKASCDDGELNETIREIESESETAFKLVA